MTTKNSDPNEFPKYGMSTITSPLIKEETYVDRMQKELLELDTKIILVNKCLDACNDPLLTLQVLAMATYSNVLKLRIKTAE